MTVATLGPEGTFSHEIARHLFGNDIVLLPTIRSVFQHVQRGESEGIVPIENSEAGGVGETLDGLQQYRVYITGETYMRIRHHLVAPGPIADLSVLYVHPQTHEQCSDFIDRIGLEVIHTSSNAASVREATRHTHAGAISSSMAASLYGLPLLMTDVQNNPNNTTRFVILSHKPRVVPSPEKCSILIDPSGDRVGLLHDLLAVFSDLKINLTRIESRPSKRGMGSYVFFLDFEARGEWKAVFDTLADMAMIKEFGCYRRLEGPE